jgi:hypothetical protein
MFISPCFGEYLFSVWDVCTFKKTPKHFPKLCDQEKRNLVSTICSGPVNFDSRSAALNRGGKASWWISVDCEPWYKVSFTCKKLNTEIWKYSYKFINDRNDASLLITCLPVQRKILHEREMTEISYNLQPNLSGYVTAMLPTQEIYAI